MKEICETRLCTGCTACKSICPQKAIRMEENHEGFFYPVIDETLCVDCGMCQKVCPINHFDFSNTPEPVTYAVMANDELRKESSSGAFFPVLAEEILTQGGLVAGAAFDEAMVLKHVLISAKDQLGKLKGSKYLQSQMLDVFREVKDALSQGKKILFTGTPCQVAGLKNFIGKDEENLITADLICHGVPSQKVFDHYLRSEFPGEKVLDVNFRDKRNGWGIITITVRTSCAECSRNEVEDTYMRAFYSDIALRSSCYDCAFARMPRPGDFTIGDFWGVPKAMNDKKGTSVVLLNNRKAEDIFRQIRAKFRKTKQYPVSRSLQAQPRLSMSALRHPARTAFFAGLDSRKLDEGLSETLSGEKNIALLNFHWENVNFGAVLTSFALNRYLNTHGYFARNIDYVPAFPWIWGEEKNPQFEAFRRKHLPQTGYYSSDSSLSPLNREFSTFIVGSDQVWRYEFIQKEMNAYFLSFAEPDKKMISYAASFGTEEIHAPESELAEYRDRLSLFDAVGVRERSGVDICRRLGCPAEQVCDPVFLLPREEWDRLADEWHGKTAENDIVFYTINEKLGADIHSFVERNRAVFGAGEIRNITFHTGIEEWLARIRNCRFFIADSFHGCCFAIIFNKPFLCINPNRATATRMLDLFASLRIDGRYYSGFAEAETDRLWQQPIDYAQVNEKLGVLRERGAAFLLGALAKDHTDSDRKREIRKSLRQRELKTALRTYRKTTLKYYRYKLLSRITWGRRKQRYEMKRRLFRIWRRRLKRTLKVK